MRNTSEVQEGSVLLCALCTILVISLIGVNVLVNCSTRYNVTSKQVKAWKEALIAAEAGGDVGYAECRKTIGALDPVAIFAADGWTTPSPAPTNPTWIKTVSSFGEAGSLSSKVTVDRFWIDTNGGWYYRIRATGTARLLGLRRTGMDDRMSTGVRFAANSATRGDGDTLLRKIDFNYDHFKATYGDGDGNGIGIATVAYPQLTRRVELIATPMDAFEAAIKCLVAFNGPGPASVVDSYDSHNTPPLGVTTPPGSNYYFAANNPSDPNYVDSRNGNVMVNTPTFSEGGPIYGAVDTNGGNLTHAAYPNIYGTIDNSVSFTVPPVLQPSPPVGLSYQPGTPNTINPTVTSTNPATPDWYLYSNFKNVTINARQDPVTGHTLETYVTVVVTGDVGGNGNTSLTFAKGVNAKIYFAGNYSLKATNTFNNNVDGAAGVYQADGITPSTNVSRAAHLQFYGINPPAGTTQTIDVNPGGGGGNQLWAMFYAPGADFHMNGNPDLFGAVVCKTFYGNGNCGFHYDEAAKWTAGPAVNFRVASYVEDTR